MSLREALKERAENFIKPKPPEPKPEIADEYDMLMAKFERDLGKFPFQALWPQVEEGSLVKVMTIVNAVLLVIVLLTVAFKK